MIRFFTVCILLASLTITSSAIRAEGGEHHGETIVLQPDLLALLQAEMREITTGVQKIPVAIAQADWETLIQTSQSIQSSYIMARALTKEQKEALKSNLPARFKQLDSEFHARAGMLAQAAEATPVVVSGPDCATDPFAEMFDREQSDCGKVLETLTSSGVAYTVVDAASLAVNVGGVPVEVKNEWFADGDVRID